MKLIDMNMKPMDMNIKLMNNVLFEKTVIN